jgi:hypothetical protein
MKLRRSFKPHFHSHLRGASGVIEKIKVYYLNPISENTLPYSDELALWLKLGWIEKLDKKNASYKYKA